MISTSDFVKPLVNQALNYLQADPVGNLPKLIGIGERLATQENHKKQVRDVGKAV